MPEPDFVLLGIRIREVDYILTHCCSTSVQDEMSGGFFQADHLTDFLDEVTQRCKFKCRFFRVLPHG